MPYIYTGLAQNVDDKKNAIKEGNGTWVENFDKRIKKLMSEAPSGSGFDNGTQLDEVNSNHKKLVFHTAFHHMNEEGMYVKWTYHDVIITASLSEDFVVKVTGSNYEGIKSYIDNCFYEWLTKQYTYSDIDN